MYVESRILDFRLSNLKVCGVEMLRGGGGVDFPEEHSHESWLKTEMEMNAVVLNYAQHNPCIRSKLSVQKEKASRKISWQEFYSTSPEFENEIARDLRVEYIVKRASVVELFEMFARIPTNHYFTKVYLLCIDSHFIT